MLFYGMVLGLIIKINQFLLNTSPPILSALPSLEFISLIF